MYAVVSTSYMRFAWSPQVYTSNISAAFPELLCLLDGEMVSVFGLIRLLHPTSISPFDPVFLHPEIYCIHILTFRAYFSVQLMTNCAVVT